MHCYNTVITQDISIGLTCIINVWRWNWPECFKTLEYTKNPMSFQHNDVFVLTQSQAHLYSLTRLTTTHHTLAAETLNSCLFTFMISAFSSSGHMTLSLWFSCETVIEPDVVGCCSASWLLCMGVVPPYLFPAIKDCVHTLILSRFWVYIHSFHLWCREYVASCCEEESEQKPEAFGGFNGWV